MSRFASCCSRRRASTQSIDSPSSLSTSNPSASPSVTQEKASRSRPDLKSDLARSSQES